MDGKGRVWMPTIYRRRPEPAYCKDGSVPSSKYFPLTDRCKKAAAAAGLRSGDQEGREHPLCAGGNHRQLHLRQEHAVYERRHPVISWINTKVWDEDPRPKKATGWCPMVLDTNGDGKIDPDTPNGTRPTLKNYGGARIGETGPWQRRKSERQGGGQAKIDPKKDTQCSARYLYGMSVAKDGSVWEAAYVPYVPSGIVHMIPGKNPPETCKTEFYEPPKVDGKYAAFGIRGVGVDAEGVAWAAFSSGQVGRFDRNKCKVTNGPTATGQQCPEGWTFYDLPSPHVGNTSATSDFVYSEWDDFQERDGAGQGTPLLPGDQLGLGRGAEERHRQVRHLPRPLPDGLLYPRHGLPDRRPQGRLEGPGNARDLCQRDAVAPGRRRRREQQDRHLPDASGPAQDRSKRHSAGPDRRGGANANPAAVAADASMSLIGWNESEIRTVFGAPAVQEDHAPTKRWVYHARDNAR
jgi:hypothetical protein